MIDVKSRGRAFGKVRLQIIAIGLTAPGGFAKTVVFDNFYQIARKRVNPDRAFGRDIHKSQAIVLRCIQQTASLPEGIGYHADLGHIIRRCLGGFRSEKRIGRYAAFQAVGIVGSHRKAEGDTGVGLDLKNDLIALFISCGFRSGNILKQFPGTGDVYL